MRTIIHNYLPKRRARDAEPKPSEGKYGWARNSKGEKVRVWIPSKESERAGGYGDEEIPISREEGRKAYAEASKTRGKNQPENSGWSRNELENMDAKDASAQEVEAYYKRLQSMERSQLEKIVGGRLDPSHLRSEPKSNLINAALNAKFSRKDIEAWYGLT
jgi:hypothetical protein